MHRAMYTFVDVDLYAIGACRCFTTNQVVVKAPCRWVAIGRVTAGCRTLHRKSTKKTFV
jgi:hypothetical protein